MTEDVRRTRRLLAGLARNPAAPVDILTRLPPGEVAYRRDLTVELAAVLLDTGDPDVANRVDFMSESPEIHRMIDEHPNPVVRDARRNDIMDKVRKSIRVIPRDLARFPDLTELVHDPDPKIRAGIAESWPDMPEATRRALLNDPDPGVRAATARHNPIPEDMHAASLTDPALREHVLAHVRLTPELARQLEADAEDEFDLALLAGNPTLPSDVRDRLAAHPDPMVVGAVLARRDLPEDRRRALYAGTERHVLRFLFLTEGLGWLRDLPAEELAAYADSPIPEFRQVVAARPEFAAGFDDDEDEGVRRTAAARPDTPPDVLERLMTDHGPWAKFHPDVDTHPNFPPAAFVRFAADHRGWALRGPDLPAEIVARLAGDPGPSVRRQAAAHPRIPVENLVALLDDDNLDVVEAAASNPVLPLAEMERLVVSVWPGVGDSSHEWGT